MENSTYPIENTENQWKTIYRIGFVATILVLTGIILDMIVGNLTGGDISSLPATALEKFEQFRQNELLALYHMDLLNMVIQIIMIFSYFALYAAHRETCKPYAFLAFIIFLTGSILFIAGNTALTMLDLSNKFHTAATEEQKMLFAAAGEAMLAKGAHGSPGVFVGFSLPTLAGIIMSGTMLKGKIFGKTISIAGLAGNSLMLIYLVLITYVPETKKFAIAFATPGGLLCLVWMIGFSVKFFKLAKN